MARSAASARRRPSSPPRCRSTASPRRWAMSPLELRRRWVYREGDTTPTGQVLRESVGGEEVLERAAEAAEFERVRAQTHARAGARGPRGRAGRAVAHRASAWRSPGTAPASPAAARSRWRRVASVELTDDGTDPVLTASTEMGQGTKTIFPQLVAAALGVRVRRRRDRAAGHLDRARLRPDRRLAARRWSSAGCSIKAARPAARPGGGRRPAARFADSYRDYAASTAACASTSSSSPTRA